MIYEEQSDYNDSDIFANQRDQLNFEREGFWGAIPDFFSQVAEKTTETFQGLADFAMGTKTEHPEIETEESHTTIVKKFMGVSFLFPHMLWICQFI